MLTQRHATICVSQHLQLCLADPLHYPLLWQVNNVSSAFYLLLFIGWPKFCLPKSLFALLVPRNEIFSFCFSHLLVAAVIAYRRIIFRFHFSYGFESEKLYQQWHTRACERVVVVGCSGSQVEGSFTYALHTHIIYAHIFLLLYNDMHKNSYRRSLQ